MLEWLKKALRSHDVVIPVKGSAQDRAADLLRRGNEHLNEGRLDEAVSHYEESLGAVATAVGYVNLGFGLKELGRHREAEMALQQAMRIDPAQFDAVCLLGELAMTRGDALGAMGHFRRALALQPHAELVLRDLIAACMQAGDGALAADTARAAVSAYPGHADFHNLLGLALHSQSRHDEAALGFEAALRLDPDHALAHNNLGLCLIALGRHEEAVASFGRAIALRPDYARAHNNLGNALEKLGRLDEAVASYERALALDPQFVQAHGNLAVVINAQGRQSEAIAQWRHTLSLDPNYLDAWIGILYAMTFMGHVSPEEYLAQARLFGEACLAHAKPYGTWNMPLAPLQPGEPLRVGFVSGDLRTHPVGYFLENVIRHVDPARLTLLAYSNNPYDDALTERIRPHFAAWTDIAELDDAQAAARIHADGVHILADLTGLLAYQRAALFAWRAAPVQLTWLGYYASTGVPGMDFIIADRTGVPPGHEGDFTEAVRFIPDTRLCFSAPLGVEGLQANALPALRNGYLTLGCYQAASKLRNEVLALWGTVLHAMPTARLRLQNKHLGEPATREALLARLEAHGIPRHRVDAFGPMPREAYLAAYHEVDIMLDTFPYGGGTTTCEALWMGVPTISFAGRTLLARQGASLLGCAGLADWVAEDMAGYLPLLLEKAADLQALSDLRSRLREQVMASPLFDGPLFAQRLTGLLHAMWTEKATISASPAA